MNTQYLVTERTECETCKGTGILVVSGLQMTPICRMCEGSGDFECPVDLLDVLKRLKFQMEGDTDGNSHWGFVTSVEVDDE